jgi:hypothetical protein
MSYRPADFAPLRNAVYGVAAHWTTETLPREGEPLAFAAAVDAFDAAAFAAQVAETGAGYVLFAATHAVHHLPCPHPEVDRLIVGRTCRRDLVMDLADALVARGIGLMLYYNHGVQKRPAGIQDPEWQAAAGAFLPDRSLYYDNYCRIVSWMGRRYGRKLIGWWFDSAWAFASSPQTDWPRLTAAAKDGFPDRLVCYNTGIEETAFDPVTPCQDYWAGESTSLAFRPSGPRTPGGLPWHALLSWNRARDAQGRVKRNTRSGRWIMDRACRELDWPAPPVEDIVAYVDAFRACGGAVTVNLMIYQDGTFLASDIEAMRQVRGRLRAKGLAGHT